MEAKRNLIWIFLPCALLFTGFVAEAQPVITQQPTNQTVTVGGSAIFSVAVSGTGPFSYQWLRYGTNLPYTPTITTVAGNGTNGYSGDGSAAIRAELNDPLDLAVDSAGNMFIADTQNQRIRKVGTNGIISTVAGDGAAAYYPGDGGSAIYASLHSPSSVAVDNAGNLFIADGYNERICKVGMNGIIITVAGNGPNGYSGDGGAATNAELYYPMGVAVDNAGNIFIADYINDRVRKVGTNGIITTVAGNGKQGYSGDGIAATNAALFYPRSVAVDSAGNLFIADLSNQRIRKVGTNGIITTVAGNGTNSFSGDGSTATNATLWNPSGVAVDSTGNLFIADIGNDCIRKVGTDGIITTVAGMAYGPSGYSGDGGAATNAELYSPSGVTLDSAGNLFIADVGNQSIRKVWMNSSIPSLTLTNISDPSSGNYQLIVYGNGGSVTSSVATLTIAYPPSIVSQPTNQIVIIGSNALFSVSASGVSLSYHWRSNSVNILNATNSTLTLNSIQTNAAASYSVNVTNIAGGVTSSNATLTVVMAGYNQISSPVLINGKMRLSFVGIAGGNYALDRSFSLFPANWIHQITNLADANGNLIFTNTPDSTTNNFWRIRSAQ